MGRALLRGRVSRLQLELDDAAREREQRILEQRPFYRLPPPVRGFSAFLNRNERGFLPLAEAAELMDVSEDDIVEMVNRGHLSAELRGTTVFVQPAVVSITTVVDRPGLG
jgi:hypothetical protein